MEDEYYKKIMDEAKKDPSFDLQSAETIRKIQDLEMKSREFTPDEMLDDKAYCKQWNIIGKKEDGRLTMGKPIVKPRSELMEKWAKFQKGAAKASHDRATERHLRAIEIQRDAINNKAMDINAVIPNNDLKILVKALTQEYENMTIKSSEFINKKITLLLKPVIPKILKIAYTRYPMSVKQCPGFLYTASEEFGQGKTFWATPNIPYFLQQGTEQSELDKLDIGLKYRIDKAVAQYLYNKDMLLKKEVEYASHLTRCNTYFELAKHYPFWYDLLMQKVLLKK
jgi:hypothetical protein